MPQYPTSLTTALCLLMLFWFQNGHASSWPEPADMREAGIRYEHGQGVDQDYSRAYELYCVAALQGDSEAAFNLGMMNVNGHGVKTDHAIAAYWFRHAVDKGVAEAGPLLKQLGEVATEQDPVCPLPEASVVPDRTLIKKWVKLVAPEYGVDARLVHAVILVESGFNPRAHSNKDARGLMQLLPSTAKRFGVEDIWDPVQNIRGGVSYLRWLIEHFDGRLSRVLAAYNAGEHAVEKYDGIPPYRETKKYVRRILILYRRYRHPVDPIPISEAGITVAVDKGSSAVM